MKLPLTGLFPGQGATKSLNEVVQVGDGLQLRRSGILDAPLSKSPNLESEHTRYLGSITARIHENLRATSSFSLYGEVPPFYRKAGLGLAFLNPMTTFPRDLAAALRNDDQVATVLRCIWPPETSVRGLPLVVLMQTEEPADANFLHDAGRTGTSGDREVLQRLPCLDGRTKPARLAAATRPSVPSIVTELDRDLGAFSSARAL